MSNDLLYLELKYVIVSQSNGTMAEAWRGGIGKYPTYPEGLGNTPLMSGGEADGRGGYCQPRRISRVFSNTSEPCLCH